MKLFGAIFVILIICGAVFLALNSRPLRSSKTETINAVPSTIPSLTATPTPTPTPTANPLKLIHQIVPFTSQAPFAQWSDPRQQDGCEEASVLMAVKWARNEQIESKDAALKEILDISEYQLEKYGSFHDTSAKDTAERIFKDYYKYDNINVVENISVEDIISTLQKNKLVITPMNGQAMNNPHFKAPGPERHMVLIIGYDPQTKEIITNDPGIAQGKDYRYPINVFFNAIRDYPSGDHQPIVGVEKNMIVVEK